MPKARFRSTKFRPARAKPPVKVSEAVKPVEPFELDDNIEAMDGPDTRKQIDRRQLPRQSYQTIAWLVPADETGAIRRPIIRTRDLNIRCMGFRTRQDVSALSEAILRLPGATGRCIAVACKVRRSMELADGWFDCLIEFLTPQPDLAKKHALLCIPPAPKRSHNNRRRKQGR
jgi:hypothetical protein